MELTKADIKEFQSLYAKQFNLKLSDNMARIKLLMLVRQMELVYQPITAKQSVELKNEDEDENENERNSTRS